MSTLHAEACAAKQSVRHKTGARIRSETPCVAAEAKASATIEEMRIIGGEFRSRLLKSLPGLDVRPTPDRLREALFNILAPHIGGCVFADVYAGTGAVGIEAISRGARRVILVESNRAAAGVIRENLRSLDAMDRAELRVTRAAVAIPQIEAGIIFIDPPYRLENEYERSLGLLGERPQGLVIAQHSSKLELKEAYGGLKRSRVVRQGDNALSFFGG